MLSLAQIDPSLLEIVIWTVLGTIGAGGTAFGAVRGKAKLTEEEWRKRKAAKQKEIAQIAQAVSESLEPRLRKMEEALNSTPNGETERLNQNFERLIEALQARSEGRVPERESGS